MDLWQLRRGDERVSVARAAGWSATTCTATWCATWRWPGAGVARLLDWHKRQGREIASGALVPALTDWEHDEVPPVNLLYPPSVRRIPRVRLFIDFVTQLFRDIEQQREVARAIHRDATLGQSATAARVGQRANERRQRPSCRRRRPSCGSRSRRSGWSSPTAPARGRSRAHRQAHALEQQLHRQAGRHATARTRCLVYRLLLSCRLSSASCRARWKRRASCRAVHPPAPGPWRGAAELQAPAVRPTISAPENGLLRQASRITTLMPCLLGAEAVEDDVRSTPCWASRPRCGSRCPPGSGSCGPCSCSAVAGVVEDAHFGFSFCERELRNASSMSRSEVFSRCVTSKPSLRSEATRPAHR